MRANKKTIYPDELTFGNLAIQNKSFFIDFYLDWRNNYLTIEKFSDDKVMTKELANLIIEDGRILCHKPND